MFLFIGLVGIALSGVLLVGGEDDMAPDDAAGDAASEDDALAEGATGDGDLLGAHAGASGDAPMDAAIRDGGTLERGDRPDDPAPAPLRASSHAADAPSDRVLDDGDRRDGDTGHWDRHDGARHDGGATTGAGGPADEPAGAAVAERWDAVPGDHLGDAAGLSSFARLATPADAMIGGSGGDAIEGGPGGELIVANDGADRIHGGNGDDVLDGGRGADVLEGGAGGDVLRGMQDDDLLAGGDGDDLLIGDGGDDRLEGGGGSDRLFGQEGDDTLIGGEGPDALDGTYLRDGVDHGGSDRIEGGDGDDTIALGRGDEALGGAGSDRFMVAAPAGSDASPAGAMDGAAPGVGGGSAAGGPSAEPFAGLPRILDLEPGVDVIEIHAPGAREGAVVTVEEDDATGGHLVALDGVPVIVLDQPIDPADVVLAR